MAEGDGLFKVSAAGQQKTLNQDLGDTLLMFLLVQETTHSCQSDFEINSETKEKNGMSRRREIWVFVSLS